MAFDFSAVTQIQDRLSRGTDDLSRAWQQVGDTLMKTAEAVRIGSTVAQRVQTRLEARRAEIEREAIREILPTKAARSSITTGSLERLRRIGMESREISQQRESLSDALAEDMKRKAEVERKLMISSMFPGAVLPTDVRDALINELKVLTENIKKVSLVSKSLAATQQELQSEATEIVEKQTGQLKGMNRMVGLVTLGLAAFALSLSQAISIIRQSGQSYAQTVGATLKSIADSTREFFRGRLISPTDAARINTALAQRGMGEIPRELRPVLTGIASAGLDVQAASQLALQTAQMNRWAEGAASNMIIMAKAMADANKIPVDVVMRRSAEFSDLMANAANRNAEAFIKTVIQADRLGVSLRSVEATADRLTSDFESYLTSQAQLQAVLPGVDLTGALVAAQYGSTGDMMAALRSSLGGRDIGELPRSIRNLVARSLGMSVDELARLTSQEGEGATRVPAEASLKVQEASEEHLREIRDYWLRGGFTQHFRQFEERLGRILAIGANQIFSRIVEVINYLLLYRLVRGTPVGGAIGRAIGLGAMWNATTRLFRSILARFGIGAGAAAGAVRGFQTNAMSAAAGTTAAAGAGGILSRVGGRVFRGVPLLGGGLEFAHGMMEGRGVGRSLLGAGLTVGGAALGSTLGPFGTIGGGLLGSYLASKLFGVDREKEEFPLEDVPRSVRQPMETAGRQGELVISELRSVSSAIKDLNNYMRNMKIIIEMDGRQVALGSARAASRVTNPHERF